MHAIGCAKDLGERRSPYLSGWFTGSPINSEDVKNLTKLTPEDARRAMRQKSTREHIIYRGQSVNKKRSLLWGDHVCSCQWNSSVLYCMVKDTNYKAPPSILMNVMERNLIDWCLLGMSALVASLDRVWNATTYWSQPLGMVVVSEKENVVSAPAWFYVCNQWWGNVDVVLVTSGIGHGDSLLTWLSRSLIMSGRDPKSCFIKNHSWYCGLIKCWWIALMISSVEPMLVG